MADAARSARSPHAATATAAACPSCRARFAACCHGDRCASAHATGTSSPATAIRPSTRRCTARRRGVLISGDMLLPRISTNVSVWPAEPDADPLAPLPRVAARLRGGCPSARWCCLRTACRSAASAPASPRCASTTTRASSSSSGPSRGGTDRSAERRRPAAVPPRARPAAALLRHRRGDRASQPPGRQRPRRAPARRRWQRSASPAALRMAGHARGRPP